MRAILLVLSWYYAERFQEVELAWPDRPPSIEEEMQWPVMPPPWWEPIVPIDQNPQVVPRSAPLAAIEREAAETRRVERQRKSDKATVKVLKRAWDKLTK